MNREFAADLHGNQNLFRVNVLTDPEPVTPKFPTWNEARKNYESPSRFKHQQTYLQERRLYKTQKRAFTLPYQRQTTLQHKLRSFRSFHRNKDILAQSRCTCVTF